MNARPVVSAEHLRLELFRPQGSGQSPDVELRLTDAAGTAIMSFKLPADVTQAITENGTDWQFTMSPDGSLEIYNGPWSSQRQTVIGLDELIKRSLTAEMLDDEPDAKEHLTTLRQRLTEALALVDRTLGTLEKPES